MTPQKIKQIKNLFREKNTTLTPVTITEETFKLIQACPSKPFATVDGKEVDLKEWADTLKIGNTINIEFVDESWKK